MFLHEVLFAGKLLEILVVGSQLVKPFSVILNFLNVVLLFPLKLIYLLVFMVYNNPVATIEHEHPQQKYGDGKDVFIPHPGVNHFPYSCRFHCNIKFIMLIVKKFESVLSYLNVSISSTLWLALIPC